MGIVCLARAINGETMPRFASLLVAACCSLLLPLAGCGDVVATGLKLALGGPHAIQYADCPADAAVPSARALALTRATQKGLGAQLGASPLALHGSTGKLAAAGAGHADLRPLCPPVYHQGPVQSCTGFAVAKGLAEFMLKRQGTPETLSAMYTYMEARRYKFVCSQTLDFSPLLTDNGAPISAAMHAFASAGVVVDADWPYLPASQWQDYYRFDSGVVGSQKSSQANQDIGRWFGGAGASMAPTTSYVPDGIEQLADLPALKSCLDGGRPAVLGMRTFESFYGPEVGKTGRVPLPGPKEADLGGHAVLCVGYDDAQQELIMRNSWGPDWGDHGYFYLPYAFVERGLLRDGWTIGHLSLHVTTPSSNDAGGSFPAPNSEPWPSTGG